MTTTKATPKLVLEIVITVIVAFLISAVLALILSFIAGNNDFDSNAMMYVNSISSAVFGVIVGYKLSTLLRSRK